MQKQPSQRQLRVGEQLKHILSDTVVRGHFQNPILLGNASITITEVSASPDLRNATAYVVMGGDNMDDVLKALNDEAHIFQREVGRQSSLKFTPRIHFKSDSAFNEAQKIEDLLRSLTFAKDND